MFYIEHYLLPCRDKNLKMFYLEQKLFVCSNMLKSATFNTDVIVRLPLSVLLLLIILNFIIEVF